jgi:hypothetical protein
MFSAPWAAMVLHSTIRLSLQLLYSPSYSLALQWV